MYQALQPGQRSNVLKRGIGRAGQELQRLSRTPLGGNAGLRYYWAFCLNSLSFSRLVRPAAAGHVHHALQAPHVGESGFQVRATAGRTDGVGPP